MYWEMRNRIMPKKEWFWKILEAEKEKYNFVENRGSGDWCRPVSVCF